MRRRANVKTTLLCATKFWAVSPDTPTLRKGVRHVVRKQGFTPAEINKAERELVREGKLTKPRRGTLLLTSSGLRTSCSRVKLAPWTDSGYPGASLAGRRKKRRR